MTPSKYQWASNGYLQVALWNNTVTTTTAVTTGPLRSDRCTRNPSGASSPRSLHRSKRIAPIADSSVIEIPQKTRHAHKRRRHRSRTRSESGESGTSSENDSSSAVSEPSQAESASDEHRKQVHKSYERRPRHKTKPDKYLPKDPKPKKSKSRRNRKKDTKPKKRRRKEHADDAMDLVKNFKTAHVANDRLTVRRLCNTFQTCS